MLDDDILKIISEASGGDPESSQAPALSLGDSDWHFADGDTLKNRKTGGRVRIGNVDTRETGKVLAEEGFKHGEAGGDFASSFIWGLANRHGFTNLEVTGTKDQYDRQIGDLHDEDGVALSDMLLASGLVMPGFMGQSKVETDAFGSDVYLAGVARRDLDFSNFEEQTDFEKAAKIIHAAEVAPTGGIPIEKLMAFNMAEYAANPDLYRGIRKRIAGADSTGHTHTPFGTGWDVGWMGVGQAFLSLGEEISHELGAQDMQDWFAAGVGNFQEELQNMPMMRTDVTSVDWTSFDEATDSIASFFGSSLPYMGMTLGGMAAAPATGGASMGVPVAMYTGLVLDEMEGAPEDRNLGLAFGAGALMTVADRLGLKGILSPSQFLTSEGKETIIKELVKRGSTQEQANATLLKMSKKVMASFSSDAVKFSQQQVTKGAILKQAASQLAKGTVIEGSTEVLQELTQYTAAVMGSNKEWSWDEVEHRMINAAVAGGLMGGAFTLPKTAFDVGDWKATESLYGLIEEGEFDDVHSHLKQAEIDEFGRERTVEEYNADERSELESNKKKAYKANVEFDVGYDIEDSATSYKEENAGFKVQDIWAAISNPKIFIQASSARALGDLAKKYPSAVRLMYKLGHTRNVGIAGTSFVNFQQLLRQKYDGLTQDHANWINEFNVDQTGSQNQKEAQASEAIEGFYNKVLKPISKQGRGRGVKPMTPEEALAQVDWDNVADEYKNNKAALLKVIPAYAEMARQSRADTNAVNKEAGRDEVRDLPDFIFRHKGFRREYIEKYKDTFVKTLMQEYPQVTRDVAEQVTDAIINNDGVTDLSEAFDVVKGGITPGEHKGRSLHLSDREAFKPYLEQNFFRNMSEVSRSSARYQAHTKYIGQNGELINQAFSKIKQEILKANAGNDKAIEKELAELQKAAFHTHNMINAESGNYNRIKNLTWKRGQKFLTLLTALQGLGLSQLASLPEMGMLPHGVQREVILKNIGSVGWSAGKAMADYVRNLGEVSRVTGTARKAGADISARGMEHKGTPKTGDLGQLFEGAPEQLTEAVGLSTQETGAATTTGMVDTNELTKAIADSFFKANFLQDQTQMHRNIRASFFNDFLMDHMNTIISNQGKPETRQVAMAKRMLKEIGLPVDRMVELSQKMVQPMPNGAGTVGFDGLSATEKQFWESQFLNGALNFINQAVPMPNAFNRPIYYSDPRFMLLTQFNGYTSTFTANQLPRLWENLTGPATLGLRYSSFAAMGTMLFMGFMSQAMKDELKYGESSPYLTDREKILRAIYSSGLLGTTERIIGSNWIMPLYGTERSSDLGSFLWNNVASEAAASGTVEKAYNIAEGYFEDDSQKMLKNFYGSLPFLGVFKHNLMDLTWN